MPPKGRGRRRKGARWTRPKRGGKPAGTEDEQWERYLRKIYFDPRHPGSFQGPDKLHSVVTGENRHKIPKRKIRKWLQDQESYSTHKPVVRKFRRTQVIVTGMFDQYEADLADMQKLKETNDGYTFLLVVIDVFSRFLWVEPLRNKKEVSVVEGFRNIFARGRKPRRLRTDRGKEFCGIASEKFFDDENIEHWASHNQEMKANYAERVIRTLKSSLWGYMRSKKEYRYIDVLQDMVASYNDTEHRSIGMRPSDVTEGEVERLLWWHLYKPKTPYVPKKIRRAPVFLFRVGSHVRLSHSSKTFERAYDEKWSTEIFVVSRRFVRQGVKKYKVQDIEGESVTGSFYEPELQLVKFSEDRDYEIEREITSVGTGRNRRTLVKWVGWPEKFNSWITEKQRVQHLGE